MQRIQDDHCHQKRKRHSNALQRWTKIEDQYERQRRSIAIEYINASTARNKKEIEERDPVARKTTQDELRAIAADPKAAKAYIRKTSMLDALERAEAIA